MAKLYLAAVLLLFSLQLFSQNDILVFKKKNKTIATYAKGSYISFLTRDHQMIKGIITQVINDSFYMKEEVVRYSMMGNDTFHYSGWRYAIGDVYALPKKGILIDKKNGRYQISTTGGHLHWYWVKSGWLFRTAGIGYASLNVANGIINNDLSFAEYKTPLAIAGGSYLFGWILRWLYTPWLRTGNKYQLRTIKLSR